MPLRDHADKILILREKGFSYREIGEMYDVSHQRIQQIAPSGQTNGQKGVSWTPRSQRFIAQVRHLWSKGLSISEIGRRMKTTRNVIVGIAHRHSGFAPRPSPIRRS